MILSEYQAYLAISVFPGIGPFRFNSLLSRFGSAFDAIKAPVNDISEIIGVKLGADFDKFRSGFDIINYEKFLKQEKISYIPSDSSTYPQLLKEISDAPIGVFVKGNQGSDPIDMGKTIAVVGTRNLTSYGREMTDLIVRKLALSKLTIVSGMARGIDAVAHEMSLSNGGYTVAVLGCGVDIIAPPSNAKLYQEIISSGRGRVISEMPPGHRPTKGLFPSRNRIISGLSLGVVVIEGAIDSGSLITARYAAEQGRDVFALPGQVNTRTSQGPLKLIKDGAQIIDSGDDVLSALGFEIQKENESDKLSYKPENPVESEIINLLADQRQTPDDIVKNSGIPISQVLSVLTILEIKGVIKDYGDKIFGLV